MSDNLSAGEISDLKHKYQHDKEIDSLVKQLATLYEKYAEPVSVGTGAVKSELPPDVQSQWDALNKELQEYKKWNYRFLEDEEQ